MITNNNPITPTQVVAIQGARQETTNRRDAYLMLNTDRDRLMVLYLDGLLAELAVLESGDYEWTQIPMLTIYKGLQSEGMESAPLFLNAYSRDIGAASGVMSGVPEDVRELIWTVRDYPGSDE